jgi:hypothetical protein
MYRPNGDKVKIILKEGSDAWSIQTARDLVRYSLPLLEKVKEEFGNMQKHAWGKSNRPNKFGVHRLCQSWKLILPLFDGTWYNEIHITNSWLILFCQNTSHYSRHEHRQQTQLAPTKWNEVKFNLKKMKWVFLYSAHVHPKNAPPKCISFDFRCQKTVPVQSDCGRRDLRHRARGRRWCTANRGCHMQPTAERQKGGSDLVREVRYHPEDHRLESQWWQLINFPFWFAVDCERWYM